MAKLDYRHSEEQKALQSLLSNKIMRSLVEVYQTTSSEMAEFAELRNRNFVITQHTYPHIYQIYQTACDRLDISYPVPLYLEFEYEYSARTVGSNGNCAIIITNKCLEDLTDKQLMALLGRQLAHVYYEHIAYLNIDKMIDELLQKIPFVGQATSETAKAMLLDWKQCAEITADRGGAIASGSIDDVWDVLLLSMGGGVRKYQTDFHHAQQLYSSEYSPDSSMIVNMVIQNALRSVDVPFGNRRIANLNLWGHSEWCRTNLPHVYYSGRYGTEYDNGNTALEDLRQAMLWQKQDEEKSLYYLHSAAQKGSEQAMVRLGLYYLKGHTVKANLRYGESYIHQSALGGNADAQYYLSLLYRQGLGTILPQNPAMSDWLLRVAAGKEQQAAALEIQRRPVRIRKIPAAQLSSIIGALDMMADVDKLYDWLWIHKSDTICAVEFSGEWPDIRAAIAVCDSGIFLRLGEEEPQWIKWERFLSENVAVTVHSNTFALQLNRNEIWQSERARGADSIINKLSKIAKLYRKRV